MEVHGVDDRVDAELGRVEAHLAALGLYAVRIDELRVDLVVNVNDRVFYKSRSGITVFDGVQAYGVSEALGERHFTDVCAGTVEGRYYFGLGNMYGNTKQDYFGKSNQQAIVIKMSYLFDIVRTKNDKIK